MELTPGKGETTIGVRLLDCDHREMSEAIVELQTATGRDLEQSRTGLLLRKLSHFTLTHFALEESMMAATKYPGTNLHRLHHQRLMEQLRELVAIHNRGKLALSPDWLSALADWNTQHVETDDLHYGHWLNRMRRR